MCVKVACGIVVCGVIMSGMAMCGDRSVWRLLCGCGSMKGLWRGGVAVCGGQSMKVLSSISKGNDLLRERSLICPPKNLLLESAFLLLSRLIFP